MISRLAGVERAVDDALMAYDATTAARTIIEFVDDDLANWYVRLNRSRFYDTEGLDNGAAFATLHEVLVFVCRLDTAMSAIRTLARLGRTAREDVGTLVSLEAKPNFRALGKKFGKQTPLAAQAVRRSTRTSCARSCAASRSSLALRGSRTSSARMM
jgi:isoleucyl-tRNA synthetase